MSYNPNDKHEALLDEHQAASLMALSVRTLQAWRTRGEGPQFIRLGRAVRYRRSHIVVWLDARVMASTQERSQQPRLARSHG